MLNQRARLLAILALALGGSGAYLNHQWLQNRSPETVTAFVEKEPETTPVVVAKTNLRVGEPVRDAELATVNWPIGHLPEGTFGSLREVAGRIPKRSVAEGEPVFAGALLPMGSEAGLTPLIADGKRAVAVRVDEVIGIAGFIKPGALVDVLATIRDRGKNAGSFSKVILQGVRVLAIDQTMDRPKDNAPALVSVVTLEVSPAEAQKLTYAAHEGKLQLALRNPADGDVVSTKSVNAGSLRETKKKYIPRKRDRVEVIKGLDVQNKSF